MIRDVDLVHYLPEYLTDFAELTATLEAENPEFTLIWNAADETLQNEFITTADEDGIKRFEQMLGITPYPDDTLEDRRIVILSKWLSSLPYTLRMLIEQLTKICVDTTFTLTYDFVTGYTLDVITYLGSQGLIAETESLLASWLPANIKYSITNNLPTKIYSTPKFAGAVSVTDKFIIVSA